MRTIEEANQLIEEYEDLIKSVDPLNDYVITAGAMTVNKDPKNGRYKIETVDFPYVYDKGAADWRRDVMESKNKLMTFRVVRYKKWLEEKVCKLRSLVNASNIAQGDISEDIVDEKNEVEDEHEEVVTDVIEDKVEIKEKEPENSIYNITQIINKKCPIGSNNCLCCIYCKNIKLVNHTCSIECCFKTE